MRRRRTTASEPEITADLTESVADNPSETAATALPSDTAPAVEAAPNAPDVAAPKRRRSTRRKTAPDQPVTQTEPETQTAPPAEAAPLAEAAPPETTDAAPAPARRTRRRSPAKAAPTAEPAPAEEPAVSEPTPAAVPAQEVTSEAAAPRTRRRGPRKAAEAPPAEAVAEAPAATEAPHTAPEALPAAETEPSAEETPARPRRTRGMRRSQQTETPAEPPLPTYQALPQETLARLAEARIVPRKGVSELVVNGEPRLPFLFFVNTEDPDTGEVAAREIRQAYDAGIRFFTVLAHLPWRARSGERRYEPLDETLAFVAGNAPQGLILPRLIFSPPVSWERAHPEEMTRYADGEAGDVSLASRAFWEEEADAALRAAVEHVAEGPYAGRVFGFYLEHGEWFHEAARGYDLSEPNRQAFRSWLRTKYQNDVVALRASWHDGSVAFETAEIPEWHAPGTPSHAPLLFGERERSHADFHEFSSDVVARVITRLGRAIKEASGGRSAVAVSYGYTLELPRAGSGHLSLARVLQSPDIDILTGPYSYSARLTGGSAPLPAPIESITLAGKLWISEDDTKTYLARGETPDTYNPHVASAQDTTTIHARNFGAALAHGAGISWMDLWGQGWLDDPALWANLGRLHDVADRLATRRRNPRTRTVPGPDVAVLVDEHSFFGVRADEHLMGHLVRDQRDALLRSGARIGFYLLSDLTRKNFPETARLLLFLNAFHFPADIRAAIRTRFQGDGRTLAYLYGPGCLETSGDSQGAAELGEVVGMHLRLQAWSSRTGTVIVDGQSPLTEGQRGRRIGDEERTNPSFYVHDPRAQVLGEYVGSGNPSLAVRRHASWQSVFIGETRVSPELLRGLYRLAGVPTYTTEDDVAVIGDSLICLHTASGGTNTIVLPEEMHLYDLLSGETLARGGRGARLHLRPREVRLLFYGTAAEISRLGGDPDTGPEGLTEAELPPPPQPFTPDPTSDRSRADLSAEDEALMEAALATDSLLIDKDAASPSAATEEEDDAVPAVSEEGAAPGKKKRRRRRGRRGRGGEPEGVGDEERAPDGDRPTGADQPTRDALRSGDEVSAARPLPPLSELLPDSERIDGDLPPIPDEFLPLDSASLPAPREEAEPAAEPESEPPVASPRRRGRLRSRRGQRRSDASGEGSGSTGAPEPSGPSAETGDSEP